MMSLQGGEKIDIFTYILPTRYREALDKKSKDTFYQEINRPVLELSDFKAKP